MRAVVDRILHEERKAVLIIDVTEEECVVSIDLLPKHTKEGDWLTIIEDEEGIASLLVDVELTQSTKERIQGKIERLNKKSSRFRL